MNLMEAILMGIIQGVAEFLPISSSGHLAIFKNIFGVETSTGMLFDILLHFGTLVAVFICFWKDIRKMVVEGCKIVWDFLVNLGYIVYNMTHKNQKMYRKIVTGSYRKFVLLVIVSTIPTGIIGVLAGDLVEAAGGNMLIIGVCLMITACLLFISDRAVPGHKTPKNITYKNAFGIGVAQGVATLPGISRSGMTIAMCTISGFDRKFAVKYSFIMSIPVILGAVLLDIKDLTTANIPAGELVCYAVGTVIAGIVGFVCIKFVNSLVRNRKFKYFGVYCIVMGVICVLWHLIFA